ncbi:MAG: hypothetical protein ACI835_002776 [Planctomycetota bacterium]|jgi:hypothetical protein
MQREVGEQLVRTRRLMALSLFGATLEEPDRRSGRVPTSTRHRRAREA